MFFEWSALEPHSKVSVTSQKDEGLREDPSKAGTGQWPDCGTKTWKPHDDDDDDDDDVTSYTF
jgi:hypothetical protein